MKILSVLLLTFLLICKFKQDDNKYKMFFEITAENVEKF